MLGSCEMVVQGGQGIFICQVNCFRQDYVLSICNKNLIRK